MLEEKLSDEELQESRQHLMNVLDDLFGHLMYDDRKEDEDLPRGRIEILVARNVVTPEEIAAVFQRHVFQYFKVVTPP
jgi:hypothetical protein